MARKPTELVTSDWHLQPGAWKRNPDIWGDSYYALEQIVALCVKWNVDLLAAGDLFDVLNPDADSLYRARTAVEAIDKIGKRVIVVQGQHEFANPPYMKALHDRVIYVGDGSGFRIGGGVIADGLDYMQPAKLLAEFAKIGPDRHVQTLFTHQVWKDLIPWRHNAPSFADAPYRMIITGDFHRHFIETYGGKFGPVTVVSPGSTCMQALDEDPIKKVFLRYDDGSLESIPLLCRVFRKFRVESTSDLEETITSVNRIPFHSDVMPVYMHKPVVRIEYADDLPEAHSRLQRAFADVHLFLEPFKTGGDKVELKRDDRSDATVQTCLSRIVPVGSPVYRDVARVLNAPDVAAEVEAVMAGFQIQEDGRAS